MHSVLPLYRKPEFVRRANLYVAEQTRSLCELRTELGQSGTNSGNYLSSTTTVEPGHEVSCTLDRVDDPSGDYNCQANLSFRRPRRQLSLCVLFARPSCSNYGNYYCRPKTGANVNCRPKRNYQRQLSLGRRRRSKQDTKLSTRAVRSAVHSTVYFVSKKNTFNIYFHCNHM